MNTVQRKSATITDVHNEMKTKEKGEMYRVYLRLSDDETVHQDFVYNNIHTFDKEFYDFFYEKYILDYSIQKYDKLNRTFNITKQQFMTGPFNCLLAPIKLYAEKMEKQAKSVSTQKKYITLINKTVKYNELFKNGVDYDKLKGLCDKMNVGIVIYPINHALIKDIDPIIDYSPKEMIKKFTYYNTCYNHVEHYFGGDTEEVDAININDYDYLLYKKYGTKVTSVVTSNKVYKVKDPKAEIFKKFEEETGLNNMKICSVRYKDLSNFIFAGTHDSATYDFKYIKRDTDDKDAISVNNSHKELINEGSVDIKGIDQIKAYTECKMCDYYEGYPAKITDFRKTNKIEGLGFYEIRNLKCSDLLRELGYQDSVYPSSDLKFLSDNGATFEIFQGAWGTSIDFDYPDYMFKKQNGVALYALHAGCSMITTNKSSFVMKENTAKVLNNFYDLHKYKDEYSFRINRNYAPHLCHVYAFIFSYLRIRSIQMIQKIITQNGYSSLVRVCKDGIYYTGKKITQHGWDNDKQIKLGNYGSYYISPRPSEIQAPGLPKDFHRVESHIGAGGTGKTTKNINDLGNVGLIYSVNSHKLRNAKATEFSTLNTTTNAVLLTDTVQLYKKQNLLNSNIILVDECSMLTEDAKNYVIKKYPFHKIMFVGDVECQLPPYTDDVFKPSMTTKHTKVYRYSEYFRFTGKLKEIQENMRNYILSEDDVLFMNEVSRFQTISFIPEYTINDIIICYRNSVCDDYTEEYKDLQKYYITCTGDGYSQGEICLTRPDTDNCKIKHGYTAHSVQGETFEGNIYIDYYDLCKVNFKIKSRLIYTAITRARKYSQIYFIRPI